MPSAGERYDAQKDSLSLPEALSGVQGDSTVGFGTSKDRYSRQKEAVSLPEGLAAFSSSNEAGVTSVGGNNQLGRGQPSSAPFRTMGKGRGGPKPPVACKFYSQGTCMKGDQCPFSHNTPGGSVSPHAPGAHNAWDSSSMHMPPSGHSQMHDHSMYPPSAYSQSGYQSMPTTTSYTSDIPPHPSDNFAGAGWSQKATLYRHLADRTLLQQQMGYGKYPGYKNYEQAEGDIPEGAEPESSEIEEEEDDDEGSGKVTTIRDRLNQLYSASNHEGLLFPSLVSIVEDWEIADSDLILGLGTNAIGLTRFKSVLMKRSIRHCSDAGHTAAFESLIEWEKALLPWLPQVPGKGDREMSFSKYFENNLCTRMLQVLCCMAASPFTRFRLPEGAGVESAQSDPAAQVVGYWRPFSSRHIEKSIERNFPQHSKTLLKEAGLYCGAVTIWTPSTHHMWPVPFRGRVSAFVRASTLNRLYKVDMICLCMYFVILVLKSKTKQNKPTQPGGIMDYLPPVCAEDVPTEDATVGKHDFLDIVCAVLAHYSLNALGSIGEEALAQVGDYSISPLSNFLCLEKKKKKKQAKERLGEAVWPLVLGVFGETIAPKITGMFLQMDMEDLLLDLVNAHRFSESLEEAMKVLESSN